MQRNSNQQKPLLVFTRFEFFLFTKYKMIGKKINILLKRYLYSNSLYLLFNQK